MVSWGIVKTVMRLTLFYIIVFAFFVLAGTGVSTIRAWLEGTLAIPPRSISFYQTIVFFIAASTVTAVYGAALFTLPSAARKGYGVVSASLTVFLLTGLFLFSVTWSASVLKRSAVPAPRELNAGALGEAGLIADYRGASFVYLDAPMSGLANAVLAVPGQPLRVLNVREAQSATQRLEAASPIEASLAIPESFGSMDRDLGACARRLGVAAEEGPLPLLAYSFAIALLLAACAPLAGATRWPFADLVLTAVALWAVLQFEGLVASGPLVRFVGALGIGLPEAYLVPGMLGGAGFALALLGMLTRLTGKRKTADE